MLIAAILALDGLEVSIGCPLPGFARLLGDDVDDTADGIGAVKCRHGAADHLDPLDHAKGHRGVVEVATAPQGIGGGEAFAIHQHQGVFARHAANADIAAAIGVGLGLDAHLVAQQVGKVIDRCGLDLFGTDNRDGGGGRAGIVRRGGDGDHLVGLRGVAGGDGLLGQQSDYGSSQQAGSNKTGG